MKKTFALCFLIAFFVWFFQTPALTTHDTGKLALYSNQTSTDLTHTFVEEISQAKESISLLIFALTDRKVIQALNKKATSGVPVKIVTDGKTAKSLPKKLAPEIKLKVRYFKGLMHIKALVIDNKRVVVGSANLTTSSLKQHDNLIFTVDHRGLAELFTRKGSSLEESYRKELLQPVTLTLPEQQIGVHFFPDSNQGPNTLKQMIRTAKKSIRIAMYTWTRKDLAHEVMFAKQRGVDVQVALDRSSAKGSSKHIANYLRKHHVPLKSNTGKGLLHHKFIYIDQRTLVIGSANWTNAAFQKNDDCYIVIDPLTEDQVNTLERVWMAIDRSAA